MMRRFLPLEIAGLKGLLRDDGGENNPAIRPYFFGAGGRALGGVGP